MVFSRIFGKTGHRPPESEPQDSPSDEPEADPDGEVADETGFDENETWASRASRVIPGGSSTGSKRAAKLYGIDAAELADTHAPTHFVRAAGCHVQTSDGSMLLDCTMALGSVALGYAEPGLTRSVIETIAHGTVTGLSPTLEVEVAERFCATVPCSERVQFLKTGAEAVNAAVRIARTYTGRDVVIGSGYFGWLDWCSRSDGVPAPVRDLYMEVPFDDLPALEKAAAAAGNRLAAIVLEPVVERLPSTEWISRARALCDAAGAVLVFDEIKTGFRIATAGYQQYSGVEPDLATFGKAMANGFPVSAVCGHASLMEAADRTWISSTLATDTGALAAVNAVLAWHERADIPATLWKTGEEMRRAVSAALDASGVEGVTIDGLDPMWFLRFEDGRTETDFLLAAVRNGVLFKRGAYNFAAVAHDEEAIREIETGASAAFVELRESSER